MKITKQIEDSKAILTLEGRLDTSTAPEFESVVKNTITDISELYLEFENLEYISSVGLRILLMAQKTMNKRGKMVVKNANETVKEIFEVTGFNTILTLE
ncbi:MAG: STAS domain-containing protein [Eubacteriales bacterium]